jgi:hypothetical protein
MGTGRNRDETGTIIGLVIIGLVALTGMGLLYLGYYIEGGIVFGAVTVSISALGEL